MQRFRIISDGVYFKVQKRVFLFFGATVQRPEDLDNKDFGGDKSFSSKAEAQKYIKLQTPRKFKEVK